MSKLEFKLLRPVRDLDQGLVYESELVSKFENRP